MHEDATARVPARASATGAPWRGRLRITRRGLQVALGCIWLLDGLLQFQSYMYTHTFLAEVIEPTAKGQPGVIGDPILTLAHFYGHDLTLWNTLAAELQCAIGLGLILSRRTVRPALAVSFVWAGIVWWFGEGFATILSGAPVSPLMGAPGAVLVYGLVGALVWPRDAANGEEPVDGGLLGARGGRVVWSLIWAEAAVLWLLHIDRSAGAIHAQIAGMAAAAPHWLATAQSSVAGDAAGHGVAIATVLALASAAIALGVWTRLWAPALALGATVSLAYWVFGQNLGGPFWAGQATDVNTGPLLVLLALAVVPRPSVARQAERVQAAATQADRVAAIVSPSGASSQRRPGRAAGAPSPHSPQL